MRYKIILMLSFVACIVRGQDCFNRPPFDFAGKTGTETEQNWKQYNNSFEGCRMPGFKTVLVDGTPFSNDSLLGKITVMYFWSLHDGLSTSEVPYLNQVMDSMKGKNIAFIAVCTDDSSKWDKRSEKFFHFRHMARSAAFRSKFKAQPCIIIFDRDEKVLFYDCGRAPDAKRLTERRQKYLEVLRKNY